MTELYKLTKENGDIVFHGKYCLYKYHKATGIFVIAFDSGAICQIALETTSFSQDSTVSVCFEDGQISRWCILRRRTAAGAVTNGRRAV